VDLAGLGGLDLLEDQEDPASLVALEDRDPLEGREVLLDPEGPVALEDPTHRSR
jgi:hypothetical protein